MRCACYWRYRVRTTRRLFLLCSARKRLRAKHSIFLTADKIKTIVSFPLERKKCSGIRTRVTAQGKRYVRSLFSRVWMYFTRTQSVLEDFVLHFVTLAVDPVWPTFWTLSAVSHHRLVTIYRFESMSILSRVHCNSTSNGRDDESERLEEREGKNAVKVREKVEFSRV